MFMKIKKRVRTNKKSQEAVGMSFSMIFSIILIIFFIAVAFMAIRYFLRVQNCARVGDFVSEVKIKTTEAWDSQKSSFEKSYILPSNLEYVCFVDLSQELRGQSPEVLEDLGFFQGWEKANMIFYPKGNSCNMPIHNIEHLDIAKITQTKNPYCIEVKDGKITLKWEKGYVDRLVTISG